MGRAPARCIAYALWWAARMLPRVRGPPRRALPAAAGAVRHGARAREAAAPTSAPPPPRSRAKASCARRWACSTAARSPSWCTSAACSCSRATPKARRSRLAEHAVFRRAGRRLAAVRLRQPHAAGQRRSSAWRTTTRRVRMKAQGHRCSRRVGRADRARRGLVPRPPSSACRCRSGSAPSGEARAAQFLAARALRRAHGAEGGGAALAARARRAAGAAACCCMPNRRQALDAGAHRARSLRWVERGGHLIVEAELLGVPDPLLDQLGVQALERAAAPRKPLRVELPRPGASSRRSSRHHARRRAAECACAPARA